MSILRIVLAAIGAFVAYFILGGLTAAIPELRDQFRNYPAVYRSKESIMGVMPYGMAAMFLAILALTVLYARLNHSGSGLAEGARFGALIGVFAVGAFVFHNFVNLNIGLKLTVQQAAAYFVLWTVVGIVIGLIYRPITPAR
jgi:hypothetical protein